MMILKEKQIQKRMKGPLKSQEFADREARKRASIFSKILYRFCLIAFFAVAIYIFFFSPFLEISNIEISGNQELKQSDISNEVESMIQGKYLGIIPKNNFILFFPGAADRVIKEKFKKVGSVDVKKKFPNGIAVTITERKSLLVWCGGNGCYLVDENGYAYAPADFESSQVKENHLIKLTDGSAKSVEMGKKVLEDDYMRYVLQIKDGLKNDTDISITEEYLTSSPVSQEVSVTTQEGMKIYFSTQFALADATKTLKIFLAKNDAINVSLNNLEYIDLRSENKIFYKLKNAPQSSEESAQQQNADKK